MIFRPGDIVMNGEVWPTLRPTPNDIGLVVAKVSQTNDVYLVLWSKDRALTKHHAWFLDRIHNTKRNAR